MASSRKKPPKPDPRDQRLLESLRTACTALPPGAGPLLLALSGGADSTTLLDLARRLREAGEPAFAQLAACHVHHGLQREADAWAEHVSAQCAAHAIACTVARVTVPRGRGLEDGARRARYAALQAQAESMGARAVLTAHHADDAIETFLLQWLRGAGPEGLAGMPVLRPLALPADAAQEAALATVLLRPLLSHPRAELHDYATRHALAFVEDPSNQDTRLARNALRREVLPPLERLRPGYRQGALRSLELLAEAAQVQRELAQEGLAHCSQDAPAGMLRIDRLATLSPARQALALRAWLAQAGLAPPSRARLQEVLAQSFGARDGRMLVRLGQTELRRHRGLLCLREAVPVVPEGETLRWQGEAELPVPSWGGALHFIEDPAGFDAHWLRAAPLELRLRTGGERFKPHPLRPSRRLKQLFQEAGIPEFERGGLPLVWRAGRLIFVAGLGADARLANGYVPRGEGVPGTGRVRLEWLGEARLLSERL